MGNGDAKGDDSTLLACLADAGAVGDMGAFIRLARRCGWVYTGNVGCLVTSPQGSAPGASNGHPLAFLFHGTLRTRLSPWVSYTSSAGLTSPEPLGRCEAR